MVTINLSNKVAYTLIAIMVIVVAGGIVYAYNPGGTADPSVMGHSINEIKNFSQEVVDIVNAEILGVQKYTCSSTPTKETSLSDDSGYYPMDMPPECASERGCVIIHKLTDSSGVIAIKQLTYTQDTVSGDGEGTSVWTTDEQEGTNGDGSSDRIYKARKGIVLLDDRNDNNPAENEKDDNKWSVLDSKSGYGQQIFVCYYEIAA